MSEEHLEDRILNKSTKKTYYGIGIFVIALGIVATFVGQNIVGSNQISADTDTPPVPAEPRPTAPTTISFPSGWSMISGKALYGYELIEFNKAGLVLWSYNDPDYQNRDWTASTDDGTPPVPCIQDVAKCTQGKITPLPQLAYYVFNESLQAKSVTLQPQANPIDAVNGHVFARGWHLMFWPNAISGRTDFLNSLVVYYSNGKSLSASQAISDEFHRMSTKVYVVTNPTKIAVESAMKELSDQDSTTTISKVPANGYYWIYLRRTRDRATLIGNSSQNSDTPPVPQI